MVTMHFNDELCQQNLDSPPLYGGSGFGVPEVNNTNKGPQAFPIKCHITNVAKFIKITTKGLSWSGELKIHKMF